MKRNLGVLDSLPMIVHRLRAGYVRAVDLAFAMRGPGSFIGEDVAELQGHGGSHNLGRLLGAVVERGSPARHSV